MRRFRTTVDAVVAEAEEAEAEVEVEVAAGEASNMALSAVLTPFYHPQASTKPTSFSTAAS